MKAYAVLSGGGIKSAALAGCLAAAEERGIEWAGCGGTSAGALVSALSVAGYSGTAIRDLVRSNLHPSALLDDGGTGLRGLLALQGEIGEALKGGWFCKQGLRLKAILGDPLTTLLAKFNGIYEGIELVNKVSAALLAAPHGEHISAFADLEANKRPALKIVATNVSQGRAILFSADTPNEKIVDAIRASMAYPFVYRPLKRGKDRIVDGGIASNLPCFLFAKEHELTRFPIFAFGLVPAASEPPGDYVLTDFAKDLLSTALEASDHLFTEVVAGVHYIPVTIPSHITTFTTELTSGDIETLYNAGYAAATAFLNQFEPLRRTTMAGGELQRKLQALYGDRKLFEPPLWALCEMLTQETTALDLRALIMLPTDRPNRSRMVVYGVGFREDDSDSDLELDEFGGCSGRSLREQCATFADLATAQGDFAAWNMSADQQAKVAKDRRSMVSVPIFTPSSTGRGALAIGTLSVDSATALPDTGWVESGPAGEAPKLNADVLRAMEQWAKIIGKLLA